MPRRINQKVIYNTFSCLFLGLITSPTNNTGTSIIVIIILNQGLSYSVCEIYTVCVCACSFMINLSPPLHTEFTQGMILPTANGVSKEATSQAKVKMDKTQVGVDICWWHTVIL